MGEQLNYCLSAGKQLDLSTFTKSNGKTAQDYLASVSKYVLASKGVRVPLKKPAGARLRIADVEDTVYRHDEDDEDDEDQVYAWGNFFLPETVHMQVFAVVENVLCLGEQLVLMTCENKRVYAYDDDGLHLVASSLDELLKEGIRCPAYENYYEGDAFIHMTEEDWDKEMQSPLGKKLDEEHREFMESLEPRILENLRLTRNKTGIVS